MLTLLTGFILMKAFMALSTLDLFLLCCLPGGKMAGSRQSDTIILHSSKKYMCKYYNES